MVASMSRLTRILLRAALPVLAWTVLAPSGFT
jgi:hypothetical protein